MIIVLITCAPKVCHVSCSVTPMKGTTVSDEWMRNVYCFALMEGHEKKL